MTSRRLGILLAAALVIVNMVVNITACGGAGAANGVHPTSPFTADDGNLFEDAVEFVSDPNSLTGRWRDDWDRDLKGRVDRSDLIALVTISALQTQIDPQQRTTFRLSAQIENKMKGKAPDDLTLVVAEDAPGYASIDAGRQRLLSEHFIVFVKWYAKPDGTVSSHWHLSIASADVAGRVHGELNRNEPPKSTVIETHTQTN
jgi:hypothetical protein